MGLTKTKLRSLFILLALLAGINHAAAQETRFFRISGSAATTITAFQPDGTMVWSNAQPGATYTIQSVSSLLDGTDWVDYVRIRTTNGVHTNLLIDFNPPAGMAFIPAGSFTIGDTLDGDSEARPTNVTVSAIYIEMNVVTWSLWLSVYGWSGKRFPWGNTISRSQANYYGNTSDYSYDLGPNGFNPAYAIGDIPYTAPVGSFPPNGYRLYDMAGNMSQWCWDWWWSPYEGGTDPHGADGKNARVYRGGSWGQAFFIRTAYRTHAPPYGYSYNIGLRCVRRL